MSNNQRQQRPHVAPLFLVSAALQVGVVHVSHRGSGQLEFLQGPCNCRFLRLWLTSEVCGERAEGSPVRRAARTQINSVTRCRMTHRCRGCAVLLIEKATKAWQWMRVLLCGLGRTSRMGCWGYPLNKDHHYVNVKKIVIKKKHLCKRKCKQLRALRPPGGHGCP